MNRNKLTITTLPWIECHKNKTEEDLNKIILHNVTNKWGKEVYLQVFDLKMES